MDNEDRRLCEYPETVLERNRSVTSLDRLGLAGLRPIQDRVLRGAQTAIDILVLTLLFGSILVFAVMLLSRTDTRPRPHMGQVSVKFISPRQRGGV